MLKPILILVLIAMPSELLADGIKWNVVPDFKNNKAAMEISGVICPGENQENKWCYAVSDEDNRRSNNNSGQAYKVTRKIRF